MMADSITNLMKQLEIFDKHGSSESACRYVMDGCMVGLHVKIGQLLNAWGATEPADRHAAALFVLSASPVLGADAPSDGGWFPYLVRVENHSAAPVSGALRLRAGTASAQAPFAVAPGQTVSVQLLWHDLFGRTVELEAVDRDGQHLAQIAIRSPRSPEPLLFDLSVPSRLAPAIRSQPIPLRAGMPAAGTTAARPG